MTIHPLRQLIWIWIEFEFDKAQWRKAKMVNLCMWVLIMRFHNRHSDVQQMYPMWQYLLLWRWFEETFEQAQWRKAKVVNLCMWVLIMRWLHNHHSDVQQMFTFTITFTFKCYNQCNNTSSDAVDLKKHLKSQSGQSGMWVLIMSWLHNHHSDVQHM